MRSEASAPPCEYIPFRRPPANIVPQNYLSGLVSSNPPVHGDWRMLQQALQAVMGLQ